MMIELLFISHDYAFLLGILDSRKVRKKYINLDCHGAINEIMSKNVQKVVIIFW